MGEMTYCQLVRLKSMLRTFYVVRRCYTVSPRKPHKPTAEGELVRHFVDFKKMNVVAGKGGDGALSFLSLYRKEFAGPDGGNGGNGGHVIFTATAKQSSLNHLSSIVKASDGGRGRGKCCHGKNAEHTYVEVPLGTTIKDMEGRQLVSLEDEREYFICARGGAGGKGNHFFLTNETRAPSFAEEGAKGENRHLYVELRTMAYAGLIGFPNAGKSTLLRAMSRARPKVAAYPFTTLRPHVGMVEYDDFAQIRVADIPGLIEGAHRNRGLGFSFLRHIERCSCLLFVIDLSQSQPWHQLEKLKYELEQYQSGLSQKPHIVIGNKMDLPEAAENLFDLRSHCDQHVFPVSAQNRTNVSSVLFHLRELFDKYGKHKDAGW